MLTSMVIPPGSVIDDTFMKKVQPFVCPSLLHWLSLPRGENTLLDVFSKPVSIGAIIIIDVGSFHCQMEISLAIVEIKCEISNSCGSVST